MTREGQIILVTGIMAAGKSTIAQALAERLPKSIHLHGDVFRRMIVSGRADISPENWPAAEAQLHLRYRLAAQAAITYATAGFAVVYQDVVLGADLRRVVDLLEPMHHDVAVVVLAPAAEVAAQRDRDRPKTGYGAWTPSELDASLRNDTPRIGLWLDTSHMTIEQTVDAIFDRFDEATIRE